MKNSSIHIERDSCTDSAGIENDLILFEAISVLSIQNLALLKKNYRCSFIHEPHYIRSDQRETFNVQQQENRLYYEVAEFETMMKSNDITECHRRLMHTRIVMELINTVRIRAGIRFAADE